MRHGSTNRRQRNRGKGGNGGRRDNQSRTQVFDSNGPDVRIRGTAHQVVEKYMALAKDADASDNRTLAQSYLQHAEHYQRIINNWDEKDSQSRATAEQRKSDNNSEPNGNAKQRSAPSRSKKVKDDDGDLSLPASILGEPSKASSKDDEARTQERTLAVSD